MVLNRKSFGADGETLACRYLRRKGYAILTRNYRCHIGEIDIIAKKRRTLVFCEVKARNTREFGEPFEAVNANKQKKLRRLAESFLQNKKNLKDLPEDFDCRFDVVSIIVGSESAPAITHIENAF